MTNDIEFKDGGTLRAVILRGKTAALGLGHIEFTSRRSAQWVGVACVRGDDIAPLFCGIYRGKAKITSAQ